MSIALICTRGFGNGTLAGTIADIVLRGYAAGAAVVPDARNRGGWLSPGQVAQLRKIAREAERNQENESRRKKQRVAKRVAELEGIFDAIQGIIPQDAVESVAEAVRPFSAPSDSPVPPSVAIDWPALLRSMEAVQALSNALLEASEIKQEEEALVLLMMTA